MTSRVTLNGPVVRDGAHNVVLRDALFHSPVERRSNGDDYHEIEIGIREGRYTDWIGTWSGRVNEVDGGVPMSALDMEQRGRRLRANQAVVIRVTAEGVPESLKGSRVNFRLGRVGGRDGPAKPLVRDAEVQDAGTRTALAAVSRQINQGLSEWEESVQLIDPVELAPTGHFGGRLQVDSTTEISLQQYIDNWVEVNGEALSITEDGLSLTTTSALLESTGDIGSTAPSSENLYRVYIGVDSGTAQIRLAATGPSLYRGTYYLGAATGANQWRFCGWVWVDDATQFNDSVTKRLCCNYYNRIVKDVFFAPDYVDDDAQVTYQDATTLWSRAAGGTDPHVELISNGEDAAVLHGTATVSNSTTGITEIGIGINSQASASRASGHQGTDIGNIHIHYSDVLSANRHTGDLLSRVSAGVGTYYADDERNGSDADPPLTYISGQVLV